MPDDSEVLGVNTDAYELIVACCCIDGMLVALLASGVKGSSEEGGNGLLKVETGDSKSTA